jgi:hypothetical protein
MDASPSPTARTTNSSPPTRAMTSAERSVTRRTVAMSRSAWSPAAWPSSSLVALSPSMSP